MLVPYLSRAISICQAFSCDLSCDLWAGPSADCLDGRFLRESRLQVSVFHVSESHAFGSHIPVAKGLLNSLFFRLVHRQFRGLAKNIFIDDAGQNLVTEYEARHALDLMLSGRIVIL